MISLLLISFDEKRDPPRRRRRRRRRQVRLHRGHKSGNEGVLCERGNRKRSVGKKEREGERERERAVSFFVYAAVVLPVVDPVPDVSGRSFGRFFSRPFYLSRYYYSHPAPRRLRIPRSPRFRRCGRRAGNRPALRPKENISLPPEVSIHGRFLWDCKNALLARRESD